MIKKSALFAFLCAASCSMAQIPEVKKSKCYEQGLNGLGAKEYRCGETPGVVDCNEKLTYDQDRELVLSGSFGMPFNGTCESCYWSGMVERRVTFKDGKEDGPDTTFYESGCIQVIRNHKIGIEEGVWTFYYDSTNYVAWEIGFSGGKKNGMHLYLGPDGDSTRLENYKDDLLHGVKRTYFPDNIVEREIYYVNGLMDGSFKSFNRQGVLLQEVNYKEGKKNGELKYYFEDGKEQLIEHWAMDVKEGEFKGLFQDGKVQFQEFYRKGIPEGWFKENYPNGQTARKAFYKKGKLLEETKYDEDGVETYSFSADPKAKVQEDDDVLTEGKEKKKKKKDKKEKKKEQLINAE